MLGLVAGIVLVLSSEHVQETVHDGHALVEALCGQLGQVSPRGSSFTRVPPQYLNGESKGHTRGKESFLLVGDERSPTSRLRALSVSDGRPPMVSRVDWAPRI